MGKKAEGHIKEMEDSGNEAAEIHKIEQEQGVGSDEEDVLRGIPPIEGTGRGTNDPQP